MLCNSKINHRPDKVLQSALFKLSLALMLLAFSLIWFFADTQNHFYSTITTSIMTIYCLITAIKTLNAGEAAISYGGFANEIIRNNSQVCRIENPDRESILQNDPAKTLLKEMDIMSFLKKYLAEGTNNQTSYHRLQTALKNLSSEKVTLALLLNQKNNKIFNDLEYFEVSVSPVYLKKPKIFDGAFSVKRIKKETYFYWTLNNITAKQNLDFILKGEFSSLHDFLDYLPVGLYSIDKDYQLNYVNLNFAKFLGLKPHQLIGTSLKDFLTMDSNLPLKKDSWFGPVHFICSGKKNKETYIFQTSYRENEKIMHRGVVVHQLPTPDELQQQVNKSLDEIHWIFNNSPIGILFTDSTGLITNTNPKAAELLGITVSLETPLNITDKLPKESSDLLKNALAQAKLKDISINLELKTENKTLNLYVSALHGIHQDASSDNDAFLIYIIDATKQKNLELQFSQAQKMQAVGQLAGGIAHDFNNLLTALIGFTDLLLQRHGVGDPSFADLIQIKQNANRATSLVRQLLAFSRKQPLLPKLMDVTESFADLSQMLKRILGEKIKLVFKHGSDLGFIKVDATQFSQVIINLAVNAKDAMEGTGTLTISTHSEYLPEKYIYGDETINPGDFVVIDVTDTGCGIPAENLTRIFDPFFSTKENVVGSGTGLGLAMVYGIVCQTGGFIKVKSTLGKGTTFSIYLPRFEHGQEEETSADQNKDITGRAGQTILKVQETLNTPATVNQKIMMGLNISNTIDRSHSIAPKGNCPVRILFVEDDASVRTFAIRALKKKGYEVVDSDSAENALEIIEKDTQFDLLITDMVLPGLSGAQLTNKIKEKLPNLAVILASGYSQEIAAQEVENTNEFEFITKPYSLGDLTAKVFDVLNKAS